ncbi:MAG: hypothetical protein H6704_25125 [Myxococcales bacterium]|nr:hypothetical protein [Myxococcales bacterium]MCB9539511.1 hypothetical protein [Myxococcales bacterium]
MRWVFAFLCAAALSLSSCGEAEDNVACDDDADCFDNEVCSGIEGHQAVCKLRRGEACIRPSQCESPLPCYQGFCGGHRPER